MATPVPYRVRMFSDMHAVHSTEPANYSRSAANVFPRGRALRGFSRAFRALAHTESGAQRLAAGLLSWIGGP